MKLRLRFVALITLVLLSIGVLAAPSSQVAWTKATRKLIASGDANKGKQLSARCASCHGSEGVSPVPTYPHLAGQRADYTYKQLRDYKDGTRSHAIMSALVAGLSDQDMADLSVFYASFPPPKGQADRSIDASETVIRVGDGKRLIPSCASCHESRGSLRNYGVPVLDGQTEQYLKQSMQAYKTGTRANDVYQVMRSIAKNLTDEEIAQTAAYYAGNGR
jgi:cytochrome c553